MPDEYLPPNKILFLQNLPENVSKDQLMALFAQYPNLHEVRLIPTKKDIAFVEFLDEASATVAKDALHNYKLDGENKIKVRFARFFSMCKFLLVLSILDHLRPQVILPTLLRNHCSQRPVLVRYCPCILARRRSVSYGLVLPTSAPPDQPFLLCHLPILSYVREGKRR